MNWYPYPSLILNGVTFNSIASDSSGQHLIASSPYDLADSGALNQVYLSNDSGGTWSTASLSNPGTETSFVSVASDSTGQYLAACIGVIGPSIASPSSLYYVGFYMSTYGGSWTQSTDPGYDLVTAWTSIASNSTGQNLIACASNTYGSGNSGIYVSNDYGNNWFVSTTGAPPNSFPWSSVASNSSGQYLFGCSNDGLILWSDTSGSTWNAGTGFSGLSWTGIASDSTGRYVVACSNTSIYTSDTSGASFSQSLAAPSETWTGIASDSTGQKLVAVAFSGLSYTSSDGGSTWVPISIPPISPLNIWNCVTSDSAGINLNAGTFQAGIFTTACFLEGSKILTSEGYIPIEDLKRGDLIKTFNGDFIPIIMLGKKEIYHSASEERIEDQLYKCCQDKYPEIFEDLIITGRHSVLVEEFIDENQKERTRKVNNGILTIENKYRLPSCADERAVVYETPGTYTIYHFALENEDDYLLHGIYANGLLVETTSKHYLRELSEMTLY